MSCFVQSLSLKFRRKRDVVVSHKRIKTGGYLEPYVLSFSFEERTLSFQID